MADNVTFGAASATPPTGTVVSTEEVTTLNGGAVAAQQVQRVALALRTADSTAVDLAGDAANGLDVDVTRITGTVTTKETRAASSAVTSVSDTASSTTLLAANANRLGAAVYNDSTVDLYLKLGTTASLTSFTVKMIPGAYYEVPFSFTGEISGIWASDASGAARVTELSA
jgi:hypothetical protein